MRICSHRKVEDKSSLCLIYARLRRGQEQASSSTLSFLLDLVVVGKVNAIATPSATGCDYVMRWFRTATGKLRRREVLLWVRLTFTRALRSFDNT